MILTAKIVLNDAEKTDILGIAKEFSGIVDVKMTDEFLVVETDLGMEFPLNVAMIELINTLLLDKRLENLQFTA